MLDSVVRRRQCTVVFRVLGGFVDVTSRTARRTPARFVVSAGALLVAVAHILVTPEHLEEVPYLGILFVLLTIACSAIAIVVLVHDASLVYAVAGGICAATILGYVATRLVAFPMLADDVGNWWEPLGVVSVISEGVVVVAALMALSRPAGRLAT